MIINLIDFIRRVRREAEKVSWPTRKETIAASLMVFVMVSVMALFFLAVDQVIAWCIRIVLGL